MKRSRRLLVIGSAILVTTTVVAAAVVWQQPQTPAQRPSFRQVSPDEVVPILIATARHADVPVYLDGVGTAKALNTVTVRSQVDGKLMKIAFNEGDDVKQGDILFELDPTLYKAQLDQAIAKKAQDESLLANARLDLERFETLARSSAVPRQQLDAQRALVQQRIAQVQLDDAAIDSAKAYVAYSTIRAPISGRIGIRKVDEGNIVKSSDATGLVVITQLKPISVFYTIPQQQLSQVTAAMAKAKLSNEAMAPDGKTVVDRGVLQAVDNQVDPTTGTVLLKAEFPNADLRLWPGQFINVRLLVDTLQQVVVVPTAAVQRGPRGSFVYLVKDDNTVTVRLITVGQQNDVQAVIAKGVAANDKVVTSGFARLMEGSKVRITPSGTAPMGVTPPGTPPTGTTPSGDDQRRRRPSNATQQTDDGRSTPPRTRPDAERRNTQ
ncbi:MAG: efflux RND transporter periplasmic adaptor subunit [Alphaproteobacteria bacterium]